jgi:hypothetical protein
MLGGRRQADFSVRLSPCSSCCISCALQQLVSWANGLIYRLTTHDADGRDTGKNLVHVTCWLSPRYTPARESRRKLLLLKTNMGHFVSRWPSCESGSLPGRSGILKTLCEDCSINLVALSLLAKELPKNKATARQSDHGPPVVGTRKSETRSLMPTASGLPSHFAKNAWLHAVYRWSLVQFLRLREFTEFQDTNCQKYLRYSRRTMASGIVGVWCAIFDQTLMLFERTVDASACLHIFSQSAEELGNLELTKRYCSQDGATCQHSRGSTAMTESFFEDRVTSKDLWPLRSPDVRPTDCFVGLS